MLSIMLTAVNAIGPVIGMIALGYVLKQKGFFDSGFIKTANQLVFRIGLPAMLFINIYDIDGIRGINWAVAWYSVCAALVIFVLGMASAVAATSVPERRGVVLQCAFRSNFAIIGLPMASALGGSEAVASATIISAISIPVFNILAVIALSMFLENNQGRGRLRGVLKGIARNPLIHGVLIGIAALLLREFQLSVFGHLVISLERDMKVVYAVLSQLKSLTTPLALIALGGQFQFSAVQGMRREIVTGTLWRTVLAPLIGIGGAILLTDIAGILSCGARDYPALVALFASPVAVSSAVMADSMGNDGQLAAQLVVWTSLVSMGTIFLLVCLLISGGYIHP